MNKLVRMKHLGKAKIKANYNGAANLKKLFLSWHCFGTAFNGNVKVLNAAFTAGQLLVIVIINPLISCAKQVPCAEALDYPYSAASNL